ncbi:WYL domain-containing protein [Alteromonas sp. 1_MG-2023]|uniref:helix-turn-helix transcriptional regulator n=1 Tax=Alteromonas sp. 1_MG-2023 TaxID=3062669 RepID=UPI0026E4315C|nr:WYL domain-containing protein [Alteromonas sp. 1_MG-2023]MDO6568918.1 WYL domain-containing protein [Alteromonas sp. 1_MG-2023]
MSAFQRKLDILQFIPRAPRKVSSRQILDNLQNSGHANVDMRTVQRDLKSLEQIGLFGLEVDKRSKPFGWNINACFKKLNLSLMDGNTALAFNVLEQSSETLPNTTLKELQPYFNKAEQILAHDNDSLLQHWSKSVSNVQVSQPLVPPDIDPETLERLKNALFYKKQVNADIKRLFKRVKEAVWKHYDKVNPMGLIQQNGRLIFICTFGSLHTRRYSLPINFIRNVEVTDNDCQQSNDYQKNSSAELASTPEKVELKLLINDSAFFLLHGYKLAEDQAICSSTIAGKSMLIATVTDNSKLRAFLRGLGSNIEVVAPLTLRKYFADLSESLYQTYCN